MVSTMTPHKFPLCGLFCKPYMQKNTTLMPHHGRKQHWRYTIYVGTQRAGYGDDLSGNVLVRYLHEGKLEQP